MLLLLLFPSLALSYMYGAELGVTPIPHSLVVCMGDTFNSGATNWFCVNVIQANASTTAYIQIYNSYSSVTTVLFSGTVPAGFSINNHNFGSNPTQMLAYCTITSTFTGGWQKSASQPMIQLPTHFFTAQITSPYTASIAFDYYDTPTSNIKMLGASINVPYTTLSIKIGPGPLSQYHPYTYAVQVLTSLSGGWYYLTTVNSTVFQSALLDLHVYFSSSTSCVDYEVANQTYTVSACNMSPAWYPDCSPLTSAVSGGNKGACGVSIQTGSNCSISCNAGTVVTGAPYVCVGGVLTGAQYCTGPGSCLPLTATVSNGNLGTCGAIVANYSTCSISCSTGYAVSGSPYSCFDDVLTGSQSCILGPGNCLPLTSTVTNGGLGTCGSIVTNTSTCSISCSYGYSVSGAALSCLNGVLHGSQSCTLSPGYCAPLTSVTYGSVYTCGNPIYSGGTCSVSCNTGYTLEGSSYSCYNGVLSGSQRCVYGACAPLSYVSYGTVGTCNTYISNFGYCSITCNSGYQVVGSSYYCYYQSLEGSQYCQYVGTSSYCPALTTAPLHGYVGTCGYSIADGSSCSISCQTGYVVSGADYTCSSGRLYGSQSCVYASSSYCYGLSYAPTYGSYGTCGTVVYSGSTCSITCDAGYYIHGDPYTCSYNSYTYTYTLYGSQVCTTDPNGAYMGPTYPHPPTGDDSALIGISVGMAVGGLVFVIIVAYSCYRYRRSRRLMLSNQANTVNQFMRPAAMEMSTSPKPMQMQMQMQGQMNTTTPVNTEPLLVYQQAPSTYYNNNPQPVVDELGKPVHTHNGSFAYAIPVTANSSAMGTTDGGVGSTDTPILVTQVPVTKLSTDSPPAPVMADAEGVPTTQYTPRQTVGSWAVDKI